MSFRKLLQLQFLWGRVGAAATSSLTGSKKGGEVLRKGSQRKHKGGEVRDEKISLPKEGWKRKRKSTLRASKK